MTEDSRLILVDSHAHLEMEQFDSDREQMIARAREAGVDCIVAIGSGTGPGSLDCGIQLAEKYEFIYATIGIHPHEAKLATDADFEELGQLARTPKVIAWGEIGLDYFYDHSPRDVQKRVFLKQLERAGAGEVAGCDPLPAIGRQRQCLARLSFTARTALASYQPGRHSALFYRQLVLCQTCARLRLHDFLRRKYHFSQSAAHSRCSQTGAA